MSSGYSSSFIPSKQRKPVALAVLKYVPDKFALEKLTYPSLVTQNLQFDKSAFLRSAPSKSARSKLFPLHIILLNLLR